MKVSTSTERINELFDSDPRNDTTIATILDVSKQTISAWRKGTRSPKKPMLIRISEEFNVSIEWLMGFDVPVRETAPVVKADDTLQSEEIRLLIRGLSKLTPDQLMQATNVLRAMFQATNLGLFTKETEKDDST